MNMACQIPDKLIYCLKQQIYDVTLNTVHFNMLPWIQTSKVQNLVSGG